MAIAGLEGQRKCGQGPAAGVRVRYMVPDGATDPCYRSHPKREEGGRKMHWLLLFSYPSVTTNAHSPQLAHPNQKPLGKGSWEMCVLGEGQGMKQAKD